MAEFKPHWADKLELTIDRHEYQKLLDKPTKQVKQKYNNNNHNVYITLNLNYLSKRYVVLLLYLYIYMYVCHY